MFSLSSHLRERNKDAYRTRVNNVTILIESKLTESEKGKENATQHFKAVE